MDSADGLSQLVNYGALGVMVVVLLVFAQASIKRLIEDRDRAEARVELLTDKVFNEVAPMLAEATEAIQQRAEHDEGVLEVLLDVRRLLEGQRR